MQQFGEEQHEHLWKEKFWGKMYTYAIFPPPKISNSKKNLHLFIFKKFHKKKIQKFSPMNPDDPLKAKIHLN
jgi:hypothetical protein